MTQPTTPKIKPDNLPATTFSELTLSPSLLSVIAELGFTNTTPIQARAIPLLLAGKDVIGESKTGSGKTAAFTLPILQNLDLKKLAPQAMILCPTRELCAQVCREIRRLGRRLPGLHVLPLSGGTPARPQELSLKKGAHVVVGTPGRVLDHLRRKRLDLTDLTTVILDEADRMLDMGFQEAMETILSHTPPTRQTAFFSATFPPTIVAMSKKYQRQAVRITIAADPQAQPDIRQFIYETETSNKPKSLAWVIQKHHPESTIVFCNHKATAKELAEDLKKRGVSAAALHGDLEQIARDRVMAQFRGHSVRALVATDVAARGIDIDGLDLVVNFDLPLQPEVYVHRIGRTGRAGKPGLAISFATERDRTKIGLIETYIRTSLDRKALDRVSSSDEPASQPPKGQSPKEAAMTTLQIGGGRKEKLRAGDILGALTGEAGKLRGDQIGKIEIHDHHAYVAVAKSVAKEALKSLRDGRIKGRKFKVDFL